MSEPTSPLPTDTFSRTLRSLRDNPGAFGVGSRVETSDFYGNAQTWVVETFKVDGDETVFVQRIDGSGGLRLLLPPPVARVLATHRRSRERAGPAPRRPCARGPPARARRQVG